MKRRHSMPFGAELLEQGVRFRLWAPEAQYVELCLTRHDAEDIVPMFSLTDGWFELVVPDASAGNCYRYRLDRQLMVPDPASRCNPEDVYKASQVIDPTSFAWNDAEWRGRPWQEAAIYELHVGCFTPQGTFKALAERLDYLADLGVTAIELMPVADFPGTRNWGYDGVLPFAPDSCYGKPEDLKFFIDSAHRKGLMVLLDVVYNHFGPEGSYLHNVAPQFFSERHRTPWGKSINFDGPGSRTVRDFFIHNALYWLEEFNIDGLRLDAVHAIIDDSTPDFLTELAQAVHAGPGQDRRIHLILENDHNAARYLERGATGQPRQYTAQWNDDIHHALHVLASGETEGYYADYADNPTMRLGRCLTQGFSYQGEKSEYRNGVARGESSAHLPPTAFITFLQNHDQVGNRAFGERLNMLVDPLALRAVTAIVLLAPSPPLIFMGEEFAASQPYQFFCDFGPPLATAVTQGRRQEFARFGGFNTPEQLALIPDPCDPTTFLRSKLDWAELTVAPHEEWLSLYRSLLALRHALIVPHLSAQGLQISGTQAQYRVVAECGLIVHWRMGEVTLILLANLGAKPLTGFQPPSGVLFYVSDSAVPSGLAEHFLPPWSVAWYLAQGEEVAFHA
jgi:maltooligosyltrehalose trehalohydrolase